MATPERVHRQFHQTGGGREETGIEFSIVVPFFNEGENIDYVLEELRSLFPDAEIIAVDDGSTDDTWRRIVKWEGVKALRFLSNQGQSAAIYHGLKRATRAVVGLMDGDGQNDPENFIRLLQEHRTGRADVVCGFRSNRRDVWTRRTASKIANSIRRLFLQDGIRDTGCSQKVFNREAVDFLIPFRGMHRYLPALFRHAGLRIVEVPVQHRARHSGTSKYNNWSRAIQGIYDLIGVSWLLRRKILPPASEVHS